MAGSEYQRAGNVMLLASISSTSAGSMPSRSITLVVTRASSSSLFPQQSTPSGAESSTVRATAEVRVGVLELVDLQLEERFGLEDPAHGGEPLHQQAPQVLVVPADDLEHEVDAPRAGAQVLDLGQGLQLLDDAGTGPGPHAEQDDREDLVAEAVWVRHGDDVENA